jgi:hypothetical protein
MGASTRQKLDAIRVAKDVLLSAGLEKAAGLLDDTGYAIDAVELARQVRDFRQHWSPEDHLAAYRRLRSDPVIKAMGVEARRVVERYRR